MRSLLSEILLAAAIVAVIAGVGWTFMNNQSNTLANSAGNSIQSKTTNITG